MNNNTAFQIFSGIFLALGLLCGQSQADEASARKPNIILILADDLGYETLGANGGTSYRTPVLDRLAATGARFTHCYAQPLCTPTRVQLMTGLSNVRNYSSFGQMDPQAVTFANLLKSAGYSTCVAGKWQIGTDPALPPKYGFDEYCLWQHTRRPPRYANPGLEINGIARDWQAGEYGPDIVNAYALDFISRKKESPFLLYYPMMLTHDPFQPTPDSNDWDPRAKGETVNQAVAHFADMTAYMDKLIGTIVAKLDECGLRKNTLIIFLGDNGTHASVHSMMGDREVIGGKGKTTDAGMHVPLVVNWPGQISPGLVCADLVDTTDFLPTLLESAGAPQPPNFKLDGRSFLPQLRGHKGIPREWIYSWYSPRHQNYMITRVFAFDKQFKLYQTGEFFDLGKDPAEKRPFAVKSLKGGAAVAAKRLQGALDQFKGVRSLELPAELNNSGRKNAQHG